MSAPADREITMWGRILNGENKEFFEGLQSDSITAVLYDYDQTEANGPWMILKQLGYNVKILLGGYGYHSGETITYLHSPLSL